MKKLLCILTCIGLATLSAAPDIIPVSTDQAPKAIGPYSQAVIAGPFMMISGQIAIDPATSKLAGDTIEIQTDQALKNIEAILASHGLTLENAVRVEVYLKDLSHFQAMNGIYAQHFSYPTKPTRSTVQVSKLPLDALVEITVMAYIPTK